MIVLDKEKRVDFWLPVDEALPPEKRPTFTTRFLSCREALAIEELRTPGSESSRERLDQVKHALAIGLVGWRNVVDADGNPVPFDPQRIDEVLTAAELWTLVYRKLAAVSIAEAELGKSASPSASSGASTATAAPANA